MGNLCSCCSNDSEEESLLNGSTDNHSGLSNSQQLRSSSIVNDQTPLLSDKIDNHNHSSTVGLNHKSQSNGNITDSAIIAQRSTETDNTAETNSTSGTAENKMALIVEVMLSKLIDVSSSGPNLNSTNGYTDEYDIENSNLRQPLLSSLSSNKVPLLPNIDLDKIAEILSLPTVPPDICHIVTNAASELSNLYTNEIKITHKEDIVIERKEKAAYRMTEENDLIDVDTENDEQEKIESEPSQGDSDDELFNELMDTPVRKETPLIPDGCTDEIKGIESFTSSLNRRYDSCPVIFSGTLRDALNEAFSPQDIKERRPLLIYVHHDQSLGSNIFCKMLLCYDKIIDYLLNNYLLWAWDVSYESNGEKLNEIYNSAFPSSPSERNLGTRSSDQYPLLLGVSRWCNDVHVFHRLINMPNKIPIVDEFLGILIQFKDQFDFAEEDYNRELRRKTQRNELFNEVTLLPKNDTETLQSTNISVVLSERVAVPCTEDNPIDSDVIDNLQHTYQQLNLEPDDIDSNDEVTNDVQP